MPEIAAIPSVAQIRDKFPALASGFAYLENAGGAQVPAVVSDAIREYMRSSYVQTGAGYEASKRATATVDRAHELANTIMNGTGIGGTILGPSTTQMFTMLAECYSRLLRPGDKIVIAETGHEANIGPWAHLSRFGIETAFWRLAPGTTQCLLEELDRLLSSGGVRLVCFPHVSNLLGEVVDVVAITDLAHRYGARVVVDGVAYAPHRVIDVKAWDVDWYAFSTYKVYGPHMSALYGRQDAIDELTGPNHFFLPKDLFPYKFQLGGACHEGCAAILALGEYLRFLAGRAAFDREAAATAFTRMAELELPLQRRLIEYLNSKRNIEIVGPASYGMERVPTISFRHASITPARIVAAVDAAGEVGIRHGHMYAYRLCNALGIDTDEGVVRVSMVHYNTVGEVERLIETLDTML